MAWWWALEFKTAGSKFTHDAITQVWDYALDLKNFQEGSLNRVIVPILVAPSEKDRNCSFTLNHFEDNVYEPLRTNANRLSEAFSISLTQIPHEVIDHSDDRDEQWAKSGYEPTPTIIEAAIALYEENTVEDITKHGGDIDKASSELSRIIDYCRDNNKKAIGWGRWREPVTDVFSNRCGRRRWYWTDILFFMSRMRTCSPT